MGFEVDKVEFGQASFPEHRFCPVRIISRNRRYKNITNDSVVKLLINKCENGRDTVGNYA